MRRLMIILGIVILAGAIAIPGMAFGPHGRWGGHMMGPWGGMNTPYGIPYGVSYSDLTGEKQQKVDELMSRFYQETSDLRSRLWTKQSELNLLLNQENPDNDRIRALEDEISKLQTQLLKKRVNLQRQLRKIAPELSQRGFIGRPWHWSMGYGHHMGMYGPGACWY